MKLDTSKLDSSKIDKSRIDTSKIVGRGDEGQAVVPSPVVPEASVETPEVLAKQEDHVGSEVEGQKIDEGKKPAKRSRKSQ